VPTAELSFLLGPTPDAAYSIELHYYYYPESITTASSGQTWLGDNIDSVLLYGSMVEACTFQKAEADILANYNGKYQEALMQAKRLGDGLEKSDQYRNGNPRVKVTAQLDGGGHERGMRSGTLNVAGIVGFGKACELCRLEMDKDAKRLSALRDKLQSGLTVLEESYVNGNVANRLPHTANISFKYVEGEGLMMAMKDLAVSSGSACTSASLEPSYVLKSLGLSDDLAHSSIRVGLGRFTTDEEVDFAIEQTKHAVNHLRELSPLWEMFKEGIDLDKVEWVEH
jgi:hypothetical protein